MAIETLASFVEKSAIEHEITWPWGIDANLSFDANRLKTAIKLANARVFQAADNREELTGMGTTVVATIVNGDLLTIGSAGDSRCYLVRGRRAAPADARRLVGLGGPRRGHPQLGRRRAPPAAQRDHEGGRRARLDRPRRDRAPARARATS